ADTAPEPDHWICGFGDPEIALKIEKKIARYELLKESILDYLRHNASEAEVGTIWSELQEKYADLDIIAACLELADEKRIKPDKEPLRVSDLSRTTKFRLVE